MPNDSRSLASVKDGDAATSRAISLLQAASRPGVTLFLGIDEIAHLTTREWEILGHLASGKEPKDICADLCISRSTLSKHLRRIKDSMGARDTDEAVRNARIKGYII